MSTTFKEAALRAIALLGLIAVLLLGAWGIIQVAFFISDLVSNAGGAASTITTQPSAHELITASVPPETTAGQPVTVSWNHTGGTGRYSYTLSYSCTSGLSFKVPVPTGSTQAVACDTPFNYTQATSSLAITPIYTGSADAKVTISVLSTDLATGAVTAQTQAALTVHPSKAASASGSGSSSASSGTKKPSTGASASRPSGSYVAAARTQSLYGYPDLQVTITQAYSQNGNAHVSFTVANVGTNVSPQNWSLAATLPSGQQYPSGPERALYPGDKIVFSLDYSDYGTAAANATYGTCNQYGPCMVPGYTGGYQPYNPTAYNPYGCGNPAYGYGCASAAAYYGTGYGSTGYASGPRTVSVTVDPYNQVAESSKANNYASATYTAY